MKRKGSVVTGVLGRLKPILTAGTRLPSERELSKRLRVSRPSLREALRTLELMGVVDTRHGSGTHVADSGTDVLKKPLEFLLHLDRPSVAELHETRTLLEIHLAGRAAERRSDEDLKALDAALKEMKKRLPKPSDVTGPDLRFHQAIAAASHNRLLERLMNCLREAIEAMMNVAWPGQPDMNASYDLHVRVATAIRKRDVEGAREAMAKHMEGMTRELRQVGLLP